MSEDSVSLSFLGTGWGFPPEFNNVSGDVQMISDVEDIISSLNILLSTAVGERLMQPSFGCNLEEVLFEPISTSLLSFLKGLISDAILYYEPRIRLNKVTINTDNYLEGLLPIEIDFTVSATNSRYNYVYPFYLNEASGLNK
ncbi:MAG TPA: GPW/gp25 family protein [Bacteroidia bacterium]|nr:GPW/gp25 family protein [Bacteroidia bacterium]